MADRTETETQPPLFKKIDHLEIIDLKFVKSEHSYMEVDLIYACTNRESKETQVVTEGLED